MKRIIFTFFVFNFLFCNFEDFVIQKNYKDLGENNEFFEIEAENFYSIFRKKKEIICSDFFSFENKKKEIICSGCKKELVFKEFFDNEFFDNEFFDFFFQKKKIFIPDRRIDVPGVSNIITVMEENNFTGEKINSIGLVEKFKIIKENSKEKDRIFFQENMMENNKKSIVIAFKYLMKNSNKYEINISKFKNLNLYAMRICGEDSAKEFILRSADCRDVKREGGSGGVSAFMAFYSLFKELRIKKEIAFTGALDEEGNVLPVGEIEKKILAAQKSGIKIFFIPAENIIDVEDFLKKEEISIKTKIIYVSRIDQILDKDIFIR